MTDMLTAKTFAAYAQEADRLRVALAEARCQVSDYYRHAGVLDAALIAAQHRADRFEEALQEIADTVEEDFGPGSAAVAIARTALEEYRL